jgi:hypothetical protein
MVIAVRVETRQTLRLFFALQRPVKVLKVPSEHHAEVRVKSASVRQYKSGGCGCVYRTSLFQAKGIHVFRRNRPNDDSIGGALY